MKTIVLWLCLIGVATARPQGFLDKTSSAAATVVKYVYDNFPKGYSYDVETSDGQKKQETAEVINEGQENESIAVRGSYSYVGPDGVTYTVEYVADENGFQPEGEHLPPAADVNKKKLGIPPAALASLAGGGIG